MTALYTRPLAVFALLAFAAPAFAQDATDPYIWLENATSPEALAWVKTHNDRTTAAIATDARYETVRKDLLGVLQAADALPTVSLQGGFVYNLWQDATHTHGLWRRQPLASFGQANGAWESVIDLDALASADQKDWTWSAADCLAPAFARCLISLSDGGKDAIVVREFDLTTKAFVTAAQNGFELPEAKTSVTWLDLDTLLLGTNWGPDSMTTSGYPREVRLWHRGTTWQTAVPTYAGTKDDVDAGAARFADPTGGLTVLWRDTDFFHAKHVILNSDGTLTPLAIQDDADLKGYFRGSLIVRLRSDWTVAAQTYPAGSVVAVDPAVTAATSLFAPDAKSAVDSLSITKDHVVINVLQSVTSVLYAYELNGGTWTKASLALPSRGTATISGGGGFDSPLLVTFASFLTAPQILRFDPATDTPAATLVKQPSRFDESQFAYEQLEAVSKDGTHVPYFIVHPKTLRLTGDNPTLLYGYGGFEISLTPTYSASIGREWLAKGGTYVLANIRGGGEFGPPWHEAALREHRQRAYDDFISVAEDLISRGYTSTKQLGIEGGSNGGLLMGAVMVQRPDLFSAVVCQVPLLDMIRFTQIAAGASWIGEYGDPNDASTPAVHDAILKYSPYQNLRADRVYPKMLLRTSTADDRVGPGHARKFAARMEEFGLPFYFYEETEGGHSGAANAEMVAREKALEWTYLYQQLMK